jgi:hypothetical protein
MLDFGFQIENLRAGRGTRRRAANLSFKIQHPKSLLSLRPIQHSKSIIQNSARAEEGDVGFLMLDFVF